MVVGVLSLSAIQMRDNNAWSKGGCRQEDEDEDCSWRSWSEPFFCPILNTIRYLVEKNECVLFMKKYLEPFIEVSWPL